MHVLLKWRLMVYCGAAECLISCLYTIAIRCSTPPPCPSFSLHQSSADQAQHKSLIHLFNTCTHSVLNIIPEELGKVIHLSLTTALSFAYRSVSVFWTDAGERTDIHLYCWKGGWVCKWQKMKKCSQDGGRTKPSACTLQATQVYTWSKFHTCLVACLVGGALASLIHMLNLKHPCRSVCSATTFFITKMLIIAALSCLLKLC